MINIKFINTGFLKNIIICFAILLQLFVTFEASAKNQGLGRTRTCDEDGYINDHLEYDPSMGGKDAEFVLTNPVCLAVIAASYITVKGAIHGMNKVCGRPKPVRWFPSLVTDIGDNIAGGAACSSTGNPACCAAVAGSVASFGAFLAYLGIIYWRAVDAYETTKICGHGWYIPDTDNYHLRGDNSTSRIIPDEVLRVPDIPNLASSDVNTINKIVEKCKGSSNNGNLSDFCDRMLTFENKFYREYFYDGVEVSDNPNEGAACLDPYRRLDIPGLGSTYYRQRYYLKGFEEGVYNCGRYDTRNLTFDPLTGEDWTEQRKEDFRVAYDCCKDRAENHVCINYKGVKEFCRAGKKCVITKDINFVTFDTQSQRNGSRICVETYSLCPYNFFISGGSTSCDYFQDDPTLTQQILREKNCGLRSEVRTPECMMTKRAGKCKNYCQHNVHCVKTSKIYAYKVSDASPYFSEACINFIGDSRNRTGFGNGGNAIQFMNVSKRHFSAPIIQCFKETVENLFHNRAGHSRCRDDREDGGIDFTGTCPSGFVYEKGDAVNTFSFFEKFQNTISAVIRGALTLVIVFYGMKVLIAAGEIKKKDIMMLIVKIAVVMYFATGNAWKDTFFDGVYQASDFFSTLVFKVQMPQYEDQRDGCQFGRVYTTIEVGAEQATSMANYPEGKGYLAIWDTLDCKLARYIGFGPGLDVMTIANIVVAGWLIGPIGTYLVSIFFIFAFLMITLIIRAVHVFLASTVAIIILIFISPITITCVLTEKTKDIFNSWLKQLVSFAIQPMILCVYLAIVVSVLDISLKGQAVYYGDAPVKMIDCGSFCAEEDGSYARDGDVIISSGDPRCGENNRKIVNPKSTSLECLIRSDQYSSFPGLNLIGINIPFLLEFFFEEPKTRMMTIIRSLIVIYFLYKFMDEVPNIASQLFGGARLPMSSVRVGDLYKNFHGKLQGVSQRAGRGIGKVAGGAKNLAERGTRYVASKKKKNEGGKDSGSSADSAKSKPTGGDGGGSSSSEA